MSLIKKNSVLFCFSLIFFFSVSCSKIKHYKKFNESNNLQAEYYLKNGKLHGIKKTYFENERINTIECYENGQENGWFSWYLKNGDISSVGYYVKGKLNGPLISYYNGKNIKSSTFYKDGVINGLYVEYHKNGRIRLKGHRIGDKYLDYSIYDTNGNLIKVKNFDSINNNIKINEKNIAIHDRDYCLKKSDYIFIELVDVDKIPRENLLLKIHDGGNLQLTSKKNIYKIKIIDKMRTEIQLSFIFQNDDKTKIELGKVKIKLCPPTAASL